MLSKSQLAAKKILQKYCITKPNEIPIEDLIFAEGAYFEEKKINGSQGRIIFKGNTAFISINNSISHIGKKRFVIAHELGHYILHKNLAHFFNCNEIDFLEWHKTGSHESEANEFAAEILMPYDLFNPITKVHPFKKDIIEHLSQKFGTSVTATALRYKDIGHTPIAIACSSNGFIKWSSRNNSFPLWQMKNKIRLSSESVANDFFVNSKIPKEPQVITPSAWFEGIRRDTYGNSIYLYEQCIHIKSQNEIISLIWVCNDYTY
jgi:Zn-dependent peptidase ImmA (M78 family)